MVAIAFEFGDGEAVMIMSHVISPVVRQRLDGHALGHIGRDVTQGQATAVTCTQLCDSSGAFDSMNARTVGHNNHAPFASRRARQTLFDQAAKRVGVSLLGTDANDVAGPPVRRRTLIAFRWADTWRTDATLLTAKHPHARQSRKQTQFGFILNVHVGTARRMVQKPCNGAFF